MEGKPGILNEPGTDNPFLRPSGAGPWAQKPLKYK